MEFVDLETGHIRSSEEIQTGVESAATAMQEIAFEPAHKAYIPHISAPISS